MSNPYDPEEQDLRKQLVHARIALHETRCRLECAENEIRSLAARVKWLMKADKLVVWDGQQWKVRQEHLLK